MWKHVMQLPFQVNLYENFTIHEINIVAVDCKIGEIIEGFQFTDVHFSQTTTPQRSTQVDGILENLICCCYCV